MRPSLLGALAIAAVVAEPTMLNVQIEPQQEQCFHEDVQAGSIVDANALIFRGGKLDIKFRIEGPDRTIIYEQLIFSNLDDRTGQMLDTIVKKGHKFTAVQSGSHTFCLDNRMARWTAKVGTLELEVTKPGAVPATRMEALAAQAAGGTEAESAQAMLTNLKAYAGRIHESLLMIENSQMYHYHRERRHRDTLESTNSRVQWWAIAEAVAIISIMAAQVFVIRMWFPADLRSHLPTGKVSV